MVNSMASLWHSRKFLLLCLDTILSLVVYFTSKYASPAAAEDVGYLILVLQPVFVAVILGISIEDASANVGLTTAVTRVDVARIEAAAVVQAAAVAASPAVVKDEPKLTAAVEPTFTETRAEELKVR